MKRIERKSFGLVILAVTAMIWGGSYIFTKVAVESLPPMLLASIRFGIAVVILFPLSIRRRGSFSTVSHRNAALAGLFGITFYFLFENYGLTMTNASDASIIVSTAPILTIILYDFVRRRFDLFEYVGGFIAFSGLFVIIYSGSFSEGSSVSGNILSFGAAVSWAAYTYFYEKIHNSSIWTTLEVMFWGLLFSVPFAITEVFVFKRPVEFSRSAFFGVLFLSILASALGYILWNKGITLWGGKAATLWVYTIPLFTIAADIVFLKNSPSLLFFVGSILVGLGMVVVIIREFRQSAPLRDRINQ
ncbi:MAG: DMT(Drug/metabolite transporter) superfamily permease [Mesotoga infera]|jgi:drug/metabolite transporter (DMT)-like permease|uniref:DMT(Drug/metabolite transporter) superfamily permease n=1 Tax=Mesotoga infera TaxID=1236046 RepID=A0A101I9B4_9BACT|nr:MAG: DMT(Drug/metabolite transporter) superfamily permease [Mesotoga infera]